MKIFSILMILSIAIGIVGCGPMPPYDRPHHSIQHGYFYPGPLGPIQHIPPRH